MMAVPSAREMASSLRRSIHKLYDNGILQHESLDAISKVCAKLQRFEDKKTWSYSAGRGDPILFVKALDKNGNAIIPSICVEHISVDENHTPSPYVEWNIALEIHSLHFQKDEKPCARWHFDIANEEQSAPLTHLQYGGRKFDSHLGVPRWHTPLMDLVLLSEIVTANFFPKLWTSIKDDNGWCECVHMSQKLCFGPYLNQVSKIFGVRGKTVLNEVWNDRWK